MTHAPLKSPWFQILLALASEPRHGLAIQRAVEEQTAGAERLWPVMLYSSLRHLVEARLIEELPTQARPPGESERRRYYRITKAGRAALGAEADRLADLARVARSELSQARAKR